MTNKTSFISELTRRRVFRVLGVYAGAAFALLEFVDIVAPILQLPDWSTTFTLILLSLGFPIAGILAWIFDVTPDGLVRTSNEIDSLPQHKPFTSNIIIGVLTVVILGLLIYPKLQVDPPEVETPSIAILLIENVGDRADDFWTRGITEDVIIELARAGMLRVTPIQEILHYSDSGLTLVEIAQKLGVRYVLTSSLFKSNASFDFRAQLIESESGKSIYANKWSEPVERASAIPGALAKNILTELNLASEIEILPPAVTDPEAYEYYLKGRYRYDRRKNLEDTEIVRGLFTKALELDSLFVKARIQLGITYADMGEYDAAEKIFNECIDISRGIGDQLGEASVMNSMAHIHISRGKYDEGLNIAQEALELNQHPGGSRVKAHSLNNIGMIKFRRGKYEEALEYYNESLQIRQDIGNRTLEGFSLTNIGNVYHNLEEFDKALEYYYQALKIAEDLEQEPSRATVLNNLGNIYGKQGNSDEALKSYEQSLIIHRNIGDRREQARTLSNIGSIHLRRGNNEEALQLFKEALGLYEEIGDQIGVANSLISMAFFYRQNGNYEAALPYLEQYAVLSLETGEKDDIAFSFHALGEMYLLTDRAAQAITSFQQAIEAWKDVSLSEYILWSLSWKALSNAKASNFDSARSDIHELDSLQQSETLGDDETIVLDWNKSQVYTLLGDSIAAETHLILAHEALDRSAKAISDDEEREVFLNAPENGEIAIAWEALNKN